MKFTTQEMVCLNSILGGKNIFGIALQLPAIMIEEDYIRETQELLIEKGVLDKERHLTKEGAILIKLLDEYKKAEKHIFLNKSRMSLHKDGSMIIISKMKDGYEFQRQHKTAFIFNMLKQVSFLRNEGKPEDRMVEKVPFKEFELTLDDFKAEEIFVLKKFEKYSAVFEKIYCLKNSHGIEYELQKEEKKQINSWELRKVIQEIFELESKVEENVR